MAIGLNGGQQIRSKKLDMGVVSGYAIRLLDMTNAGSSDVIKQLVRLWIVHNRQ